MLGKNLFSWPRLALLLAGLGLAAALWPPASSFYDLTGEENVAAQARGVLHWLNTAVRPQPHLAPEAEIQRADVSPFGVNTFLQNEVEVEKRALSLQMARAAGFDFIRQEFVWEDIEIHGKGDFEDRRHEPARSAWEKYDNIVDLAQQNDLQIIARLSNPPNWTRAEPVEVAGPLAPPDDFSDFGDFVTAVAQRYQERIRYYQIWNEPNGNEEWGLNQGVNPEAYTDLLCLAYDRIKAVDPNAVVLAGALTPTVEISPTNLNDLIFLERMYAAGAGDCFDVMSAQGYGLWSGATDQRLRPTVINFPHHLYIRDVMVRHGDAHKPIWISEMGWNAAPEDVAPRFGRVTPAQQARYAVEAYERTQSDWPWLGVSNYWFLKLADESRAGEAMYYFRLLDPDFTPQPVYDALVAYAPETHEIEPTPRWIYTWNRLRPFLFLASSAVLFYALLWGLKPTSEMRD